MGYSIDICLVSNKFPLDSLVVALFHVGIAYNFGAWDETENGRQVF